VALEAKLQFGSVPIWRIAERFFTFTKESRSRWIVLLFLICSDVPLSSAIKANGREEYDDSVWLFEFRHAGM
jgi:hypothetical protein